MFDVQDREEPEQQYNSIGLQYKLKLINGCLKLATYQHLYENVFYLIKELIKH